MTSRESISVLIADKNPVVRTAIRDLLEERAAFGRVVAAADGERFLDAVGRMRFDVGIIGWVMPAVSGREILERLGREPGAPRLIVYTGDPSPAIPSLTLRLGGAGFCSKNEPPERVIEVVEAVAGGQMVFPYMDVRDTLSHPLEGLTGREQDLLALLATGASNSAMAATAHISVNTVKFHLRNIYAKLGVDNRAQAVALYVRAEG